MQDATIAELNRMMKRVHDENRENLDAVEAANAALVEVQVQLETQVDQLKAQAAAAAVPVRRAAGLFAGGGGGTGAPTRFGATASASVTIRRDAPAAAAAKASSTLDSGDEKPFVVGSPPLSSGSESSEVCAYSIEDMSYVVLLQKQELLIG